MKKIVLSFLIVSLTISSLNGQKVGVVFSGGAAKGLAHIGALKALEENDVPIDYIVGTSMGAVVGAFYAAGYSPKEIEEIALSSAFQNWITGDATEKYQYNYTKSQDNASWLTIDLLLDAKVGASINTPLANDLILNFVLSEYLGRAGRKAEFDFDKLFVPFRPVAADVFTQEVLSLDSGSLIQATRSSMAVPFFYRPVKFENQYLFDGGIYNNFPVDIMKSDFQPDHTIGVNVATRRSEEYPFNDDEKELADALFFFMLDKTDDNDLGKDDVFIEPDMKNKTALDFKKAKELIALGYQETKSKMSEIKAKVKGRRPALDVAQRRSEFINGLEQYSFGATKLIGFEVKQRTYMNRLFSFKEEGMTIDQIREAYFQLVSEPYFKNIYPSISYDQDKGYYVFELYLKPTAKNTLAIDVGGNLSTRNISTLHVGLNLNRFKSFLNTYQLSFSTGNFYESLRLANRMNFDIKSRFFVEPEFVYNGWDFTNTDDLLSGDENAVILDRIDRKIGLNLGIGTGRRSVTTFGINYFNNTDRFSNTQEILNDAVLDRFHFEGLKLNLTYERNSINLKQFATAGARFHTSFDYFNGKSNYTAGSTSAFTPGSIFIDTSRDWWRLKTSFEEYGNLSEKVILGWMFEGVMSSQSNFDNFRSSLNMSNAFEPMFDSKSYFLSEYRAYSYLASGIKFIHKFNDFLQLRAEFYGFVPFRSVIEGANQTAILDSKFGDLSFTGMTGLIYSTALGPLSLRLNYFNQNGARFGMMLSYGYTIFSQRSLD